MQIRLLSFILVFFIAASGYSQSNREYIQNKMFWTETVITGKIAGKFSYQFDYQYRRSADAENVKEGNHDNIFKNPFQQVLRPWVHYQVAEGVRFSLSPIGWWGSWSNDASRVLFFPEFRITPQVTLNQKVNRIVLSHRYRYEFRFQGDKEDVGSGWNVSQGYENFGASSHKKGRFRYLLRALVPINNATLKHGTFYGHIYNEIFLNTGSIIKNTNLVDQNRFFAGLGYRFHEDIRLEIGYLNQTAFRFNNTLQNNIEQNNVLQIFLYFDDFNKFFKRKKAEEIKQP